MIITNCGLADITTDIIEPISEQIIRKIINILAIEDFVKDNVYINSDYLTGSRTNDPELIPVLRKDRIDCEVTFIQDPNKNKWETSTTRHAIEFGNTYDEISNLQIIYQDKNIKTAIIEHAVPSTININCTISCLERSNAHSIFNTLINTLGGSEPTSLVDVFYSYIIPDPVLLLIGYFYKLSNIKDQSFVDYLREKSNKQIGFKMNKNIERDKGSYTINKSEIELMVETTVEGEKPEAVKNNKSTNHYVVTFSLSAQFNRPNILFMRFPIIINNQLVDGMFLPDNILTSKDVYLNTTHPYISIKGNLDEFKLNYTDGVYKIPFYDNFKIPKTYLNMMGFTPFFSGATPIDPNGNTSIDLSGNLGSEDYPIYIKEPVLDIIRNQGRMALSGSLPIAVIVFSDSTMIQQTSLILDGLNLIIPNKDISKIYRIVIYENKEKTQYVQSLRVLKYVLFTNPTSTF